MKRIFFVIALCTATISGGSLALAGETSFDESAIVKKKSFDVDVGERVRPTGKMPFEALALKDGTLWVRPALPPPEASVRLGLFSLSRTTPVQVPLGGYRAHEFFSFAGRLFVTVNDTVDPERRYLMQVSPSMGAPTNLKRMIWAALPITNFALLNIAVYNHHRFPVTCAVLGSLFALSTINQCFTDVREEIESQRARPGRSEVLEDTKGQRLHVVKYAFDHDWNVEDVLLQDNQGTRYSLRQMAGHASCAPALTPYLLKNSRF